MLDDATLKLSCQDKTLMKKKNVLDSRGYPENTKDLFSKFLRLVLDCQQ